MATSALAADTMETRPLGKIDVDVDKQKVPRPRNGPAIWAGCGGEVLCLADLSVGSMPGAWIRVVVFCVILSVSTHIRSAEP